MRTRGVRISGISKHAGNPGGTQYNDQDVIPSDSDSGQISSLTRHASASLGVAGTLPLEQETEPFPELTQERAQDENLPDWPLDQSSDRSQATPLPDSPRSISEAEGDQVQAFAKLQFADGDFYMTTHAVELGRDVDLARAQQLSLQQSPSIAESAKSEKIRSGGNVAHNSFSANEDGHNEHQSREDKKRAQMKTESWSSSSRQSSDRNFTQPTGHKANDDTLATASLTDSSPIPNKQEIESRAHLIPRLSIRPSEKNGVFANRLSSISRTHLRIGYNFDEHKFEVEILGLNGAFVDGLYYTQGHRRPLESGSYLQIGGASFRFVLPSSPPEETEVASGSESISVSTFDSFEEESVEEDIEHEEEQDHDDGLDIEQDEEEGPQISRTRGKGKRRIEVSPPVPIKRKGPGRPPKDGIRSKREQALLTKQAKAQANGKTLTPKEEKGKVDKDKSGPKKEESSRQPNGKRKYTKRKRAGGTEDQQAVRKSTEQPDTFGPEKGIVAPPTPKPAKERKPVKPPRSPSPVFDESTLTEEQLAKPTSSYVILIHEALSNSVIGQMSLPQIYRAIERRYPYFKLRVATQGWQSSVRHNLGQHAAFRKITKDGKGWMWGLVPEVPIEKEKKKKATPPPQPQQHYYPQNSMMHRPYHFPGIPPPNGPMPPAPYAQYPLMQYPVMPSQGFPLPLVTTQSEATYRSPYQSTEPTAPAQSTPQPQQSSNMTANGISGPYAPPTSQQPAQSFANGFPLANPYSSTVSHPPAPSHPLINSNKQQEVDEAVTNFRTALINTMDDKVHGEALISSAINRVLGIKSDAVSSSKEPGPNEKTIMESFSKMLSDLSKNKQDAEQQSSHSSPSTVNGVPAAVALDPRCHDRLTATAIAAEKAGNSAPANDNATTSHERNAVDGSHGAGAKRSLENGNRTDDGTDLDRPQAKRVASKTPEA